MDSSNFRRVSIGVPTLLGLVSMVVLGYLLRGYLSERSQLQQETIQLAQQQASTVAAEIERTFGGLMVIADDIAGDLADGTLAYTDIEPYMLDVVDARPDVDGLAITFEPFAYNEALRLFQTYVFKQESGEFDVLRGATYDYTRAGDANTAWYVDTVNEGAQWHEPFFATGAQKTLVEYGVPFTALDNDETAGIVSIDYTLEDVRAAVDALELGDLGYGVVASAEGTFMAHPVAEFVGQRTLYEVIPDDPDFEQAVDAALNGELGFVEVVHPITNEQTLYFLQPVDTTGWVVGVVLSRSQLRVDPERTMREQMSIALSAASLLFFATTVIYQIDGREFTNYWTMSGTFSVLCVVLIATAWVLTNRLETQEGVGITNQSQLDRYLQGIERPVDSFRPPTEIPTGIYVQSLQFPNPTSVTVNGLIWQRYPEDLNVTPGFALPQRIGEEATVEEVARETEDGHVRVVWYVGVTLRQTYDTTRFPFDHRNIMIRIVPGDLTADTVLVPDFDAYELIVARLLPGVDPQAQINNWRLQNSRFSYLPQRLNTNFGLTDREAINAIPELRFSIQARRNYLGPFIAYLLPGSVAAVMTFVYLASGYEPGKRQESTDALNYAAALFFVVAVIHTALREQIAAVGITYMEYVYILLYLAIIAVAANFFVVARFPDWHVVRYRDNLLPKVLYWPVFAGVLLLVTLWIFVY